MRLKLGKRAADAALSAFEAQVCVHARAAYNLARYLMGNEDEAKDVVQEAFLRAYRAFDRYENRNALAWILAIVRNVSYSALQRRRAGPDAVSFDEQLHTDSTIGSDTPFVTPEAQLDRQQSAACLRDLIARLPIEFREVIVLRELEDLSYREIAQILAIPTGTVMSRLARGRSWLRTLAADEGAEDAL